jgi:hypothetical protein
MADDVTPGGPPARRKGLSPQVILIIGVAAAGIGLIGYLVWKARSNSTTAAAATPAAAATDTSGQLSTLQSEIGNLQSSAAADEAAEKPAVATVAKPGMPANVKGAAASSTAIRLSWGKVTGASSYPWQVAYQGKTVKSGDVTATSVTVSGLIANHTYTCHVAARNAAGTSAYTNGPVVKTPRAAVPAGVGKGEEPGG